jgi:hypothetical protein
MEPVEWIMKAFPKGFDYDTGTAMWTAFINRDVYFPDGQLVNGSFRWWGGVIADARNKGESYLDYYCSYAIDAAVKILEKKLEKLGWKFSYEAAICPKCGKPIERNDMLAIDFKTGETTHAMCAIGDREIEQ